MRLKSVTLNNFRCFQHLRIDLHPRLTVLVGDNGAGKTAVLDGIAVALRMVMTQLSSADQRLSGPGIDDTDFRRVVLPNRGGRERWGSAAYAQVIAETFDGLRWDHWKPAAGGKEQPADKVGIQNLKQRMQGLMDSYKVESPQLTPVFAYYGAQRGTIDVPTRLRSAKQNYGHPAAALIGALDARSDFREMLAWFDNEEATELRANRGVVDDNFEELPSLTAVRASVAYLLQDAFHSPHFNRDHKFVLIRKSDGAHLLVDQLSQGYQSMLALAMDFSRRLAIANSHLHYNSKDANNQVFDALAALSALDHSYDDSVPVHFLDALTMSAPAIMLVDEIDLHLHPTWQQRVLNDLLRTFPLTQFIVTTHSPQVLSTVARQHIRVLQATDDGFAAQPPDFSPLAHESGDALAKVMGTHREPELALQASIRGFEQLVRAGNEDSPDAQALRQELDRAGYQFHESDLVTWRFLARRQASGEH
ncbi:AAA family ATPase [Pseudorhodoferax sp. LjRoot39]|uniref:AAA family ATPase n=1 Tax=Pseudorhodoferax sp. LjRoot39 TaxID=3342328 RepID=UPI003ECFA89E